MPRSPDKNTRWACSCTPADALALLQEATQSALTGDVFETQLLAQHVDHYLHVLARTPK